MRMADSTSATVTTNENAEEYTVVKNHGSGAALGSEYEMIPAHKRPELPPRTRQAPGYVPDGVDVTTNANVTSVIDNRSRGGSIAINPQYEMISTYSKAGPSTNVYEMLEPANVVQANGSHYLAPRTLSPQQVEHSTGDGDGVLALYAMPRDPEVVVAPPPSSTADEGSHNLYNVPRNQQSTTTTHNPQPAPTPQENTAKRHNPYDHLEILPPPSLDTSSTTTTEGEPSTATRPQTTYDVPRTSSTTSDRSPYCNHVIIELGNHRNKPTLPSTARGSATPTVEAAEDQGVTVYTNVSNTSN